MITKKDLREIKEQLRELSNKIEALQEQPNFGKLGIAEYEGNKPTGYTESAKLVVDTFIPRLHWFNKRLDKWIDQVPAGTRGKSKKEKINGTS